MGINHKAKQQELLMELRNLIFSNESLKNKHIVLFSMFTESFRADVIKGLKLMSDKYTADLAPRNLNLVDFLVEAVSQRAIRTLVLLNELELIHIQLTDEQAEQNRINYFLINNKKPMNIELELEKLEVPSMGLDLKDISIEVTFSEDHIDRLYVIPCKQCPDGAVITDLLDGDIDYVLGNDPDEECLYDFIMQQSNYDRNNANF